MHKIITIAIAGVVVHIIITTTTAEEAAIINELSKMTIGHRGVETLVNDVVVGMIARREDLLQLQTAPKTRLALTLPPRPSKIQTRSKPTLAYPEL